MVLEQAGRSAQRVDDRRIAAALAGHDRQRLLHQVGREVPRHQRSPTLHRRGELPALPAGQGGGRGRRRGARSADGAGAAGARRDGGRDRRLLLVAPPRGLLRLPFRPQTQVLGLGGGQQRAGSRLQFGQAGGQLPHRRRLAPEILAALLQVFDRGDEGDHRLVVGAPDGRGVGDPHHAALPGPRQAGDGHRPGPHIQRASPPTSVLLGLGEPQLAGGQPPHEFPEGRPQPLFLGLRLRQGRAGRPGCRPGPLHLGGGLLEVLDSDAGRGDRGAGADDQHQCHPAPQP